MKEQIHIVRGDILSSILTDAKERYKFAYDEPVI